MQKGSYFASANVVCISILFFFCFLRSIKVSKNMKNMPQRTGKKKQQKLNSLRGEKCWGRVEQKLFLCLLLYCVHSTAFPKIYVRSPSPIFGHVHLKPSWNYREDQQVKWQRINEKWTQETCSYFSYTTVFYQIKILCQLCRSVSLDGATVNRDTKKLHFLQKFG